MAYIGNTPAENYGNLTVQHFTVTATAAYVLDTAAANENEIALFINNVRQQPGESYAYTVSGTALTLSVATAATDTMYCLFLGKAQHTSVPTIATGTITNAMLVSIAASKLTGTIDNARISLDAAEIPDLDAGKITTGTINNARISLDAAEIPNISTDKLTTGTLPDARIAALTGNKLTGAIIAQGDGSSTDGKITLNCSQNTHGVSIQSPAHASTADYTLTLPTTNGNADEVLKTDGAGVLSWTTQASGALDSPVITGTLSVVDSGSVSHTVANWSDDISYTIVPANCTAGTINASGIFVITHTSGAPSYTIKSTTDSLGLADSALVTKNIVMQLSAPTLSSPADVGTAVDVVYTITSTTTDDDKLILDPGTANFTYQSEAGPGTASKVGNTVECVGFGTGNPVVTIQFTAQATYSVTATAAKIDGSYGTSAASSADSITIANRALTAPSLSSPADVGTVTDVVYTITSNDAEDNKLILNPGTANFTYQGVSGATASKVGNTVECVSFGASNPVVTIRFTAEATYSVTATAVDTASYYGTSAASSADSITISNYTPMVATGGSLTTSGDYHIRTFTSSGTFNITTLGSDAVVEYLIISGGAAGGTGRAGGGGSGVHSTSSSFGVTQTGLTVTVGAGGARSTSTSSKGTNGSNSVFSSVTAVGGGGGGSNSSHDGANGGTGGGAAATSGGSPPHAGGTGSAGGDGGSNSGNITTGGGGGGSTGDGVAGSTGQGGGGTGTSSSITGSAVTRASGGSGGTSTSTAPVATTGGGGVGGKALGGHVNATDGTANMGGGGGGGAGGAGAAGYGGSGGSGLVIIKYKFQ